MERAKLFCTLIPHVRFQAFPPPDWCQPARADTRSEKSAPGNATSPASRTHRLVGPQIRLPHTRLFRLNGNALPKRPTAHDDSTGALGASRRKARSRMWLPKGNRPRAHEGELPGSCASRKTMNTRSGPERRASRTLPEGEIVLPAGICLPTGGVYEPFLGRLGK